MKLAMVFPGQGSQTVGMLEGYAGLLGIEETAAEAAQALGKDFVQLLHEGPAEQLNLTVNTQPAMVTAGFAVYRAWLALGGPKPAMVAGHSLGEYTALVAAEALSFRDCLPLVRFRAQAMQEAVPVGQGGMAAILGAVDVRVRRTRSLVGRHRRHRVLGTRQPPGLRRGTHPCRAGRRRRDRGRLPGHGERPRRRRLGARHIGDLDLAKGTCTENRFHQTGERGGTPFRG